LPAVPYHGGIDVRFKIHVDGAEHQVEAGADGRLVLDGETFEIKVGRPSDDRRLVQLDGQTLEIRVVEDRADTGAAVLELAGERIPMSVTEVAKAGPAATGQRVAATPSASLATVEGRPGAVEGSAASRVREDVKDGIWAPVPGKIVEVFVREGDVVDEGAAVLVLEAIKMENELHAPHKGTVAAVLVKRGDQADKGQLLVAFG